jgi:hypothetical protein
MAFFVRNNKANKRLSKDKINKINSLESNAVQQNSARFNKNEGFKVM